MTLSQYLAAMRMGPDEFAKRIGVHPTTIYRVLGGKTIPKRATLAKIIEATGGLVGVEELLRSALRELRSK